ncbi:MAG: protoporphyrinogen oxidase, partial [Desulfovibrio sp.]|nr:protoporphyrinogen oxidase [Desulfovibrio sp.]
MARLTILFLLFIGLAATVQAQIKTFTHFGADLPDGWDGEETSGFTGEKGNEYMLVFKKHDEAGENIKGVVSVFL